MHHFSPHPPERLDPRRRSRAPRPPRGMGTTLRVVPAPLRELQQRLLVLFVRLGR